MARWMRRRWRGSLIGWLTPSLIERCAQSDEPLREHEELLDRPLPYMMSATTRSEAVGEVGMLSRGGEMDEQEEERR